MPEPFWMVVRTHPNSENIATRNLGNQGFEYYQPKILEKKTKRGGKPAMVEAPLFPCYLFVRVMGVWRSLLSTYGVASIVGSSLSPSVVRDSIIDDLRSREDSRGYIVLPKVKKLAAGAKVKILRGPFATQHALVERMPASERQKVLLALLSNKLHLLIDERDLEIAA